jgi:hypothetical protein
MAQDILEKDTVALVEKEKNRNSWIAPFSIIQKKNGETYAPSITPRSKSKNELVDEIENNISYQKYIGCRGTCILGIMIFMIALNVYGFWRFYGTTCGIILCPQTSIFLIVSLKQYL